MTFRGNSGFRLRLLAASTLVAASALAGCAARSVGAPSSPTALAGISGTVKLVGSLSERRLVIDRDGHGVPVDPASSDAAALRALSGVEVAAWGTHRDGGLLVTGFIVTTVDGVAVLDGRLVRTEGGPTPFALRTPFREFALRNAPDAFQGLVGARLWVRRDTSTVVVAYGVISRTP